ncbi:hypothetical protein JJR77_000684 [Salmonella enterica]|nr:hypothetical protein [Salmonella enterica]EHT6836363.1 hypothetical protein [Salmonella enterica]
MTKSINDTSVYAMLAHTTRTDTDANASVKELNALAESGEVAVIAYLEGLRAIGNLTFWACANENYSDHASDLRALGAFLQHSADMTRATVTNAGWMRGLAELKEGKK